MYQQICLNNFLLIFVITANLLTYLFVCRHWVFRSQSQRFPTIHFKPVSISHDATCQKVSPSGLFVAIFYLNEAGNQIRIVYENCIPPNLNYQDI